MRNLAPILAIAFVTLPTVVTPASAQVPQEALDAYVKAYAQMGKNAALMFNHQKTQANARTNAFTAWVDAKCKMIEARAAWIQAVSEAKATQAKTLATLEEVQSAALDNKLKKAETHYKKTALYKKNQEAPSRPTMEDANRYSEKAAPERPSKSDLSRRGKIRWPVVLLADDFAESRIELDRLFALRYDAEPDALASISQEIQTATGDMRGQLRSKIREIKPDRYIDAQKFVSRLAYESQFPPRIDGVAMR